MVVAAAVAMVVDERTGIVGQAGRSDLVVEKQFDR